MNLSCIIESDIPIPPVKQQKVFRCGSAVVRCIANYAGVGGHMDDTEFDDYCNTGIDGTHATDIVKALKKLKLDIEAKKDMTINELCNALDKNYPVVCLVQAINAAKIKSTHYVIAIGHTSRHIHFEDPSIIGKRGRRTRQYFDTNWHDGTNIAESYNHYGIIVKIKKPVNMQVLRSYTTVL